MKVSGDIAYARSNTGSFTVAAPGMDKRKMVNNLQALLKDEIERRENAQNQLLEYRQRSLMIERQFSRLLEKYDNHVASINGRETYSSEIWNKLVGEIEKFNDNSEKMLEKRCNEILFMMNRRISEILEKTDDQLQKNKKLSEEEYKSVKEEIKQALKLAKEIEVENEELKKMNKDLSFKVSILKEQRNLLVQQLSQKKMLLLKMAKSTNEELKESTIQQPKSARISRLKSSKRTSQVDSMPIPKFICEPSFRELYPSIDNPEMSKRLSSTSRGHREDMVLKTDNHFKICFQRERRKNVQLKSIVARLQAKHKELSNMIEKFNKEIDRESNSGEKVRKMEKIVQSIKFKLLVSPGQDQRGGLNSRDLQTMMQL